MLRKMREELLLQWPIDKSGAQFREDGGPDDTVFALPCHVYKVINKELWRGKARAQVTIS